MYVCKKYLTRIITYYKPLYDVNSHFFIDNYITQHIINKVLLNILMYYLM